MAISDFKDFGVRDCAFRTSKGKERPAPTLPAGVPLADTHCHLGMLADPALAIARAAHYGFGFLLCMTDPAEPPAADASGVAADGVSDAGEEDVGSLSAAEAYAQAPAWLAGARDQLDAWSEEDTPLPRLRFAAGVHPHNAKYYEDSEPVLPELLHDPATGCLGEIGLDYHYDLSPRETQREVFARQLCLAHEAGLPVSLHIREAHDDTLEILRCEGMPDAGCILHCFNLDAHVLAPFLELGCHVAFGGPLTFKKSWETRRAALDVPLERLLLETDAPYMAPEPLRGTSCTPDQSVFTLRKLADCFGYAGADVALAALNPRESDIAAGAEALACPPDFAALQDGLDEAAFMRRVYDNAVELLDRVPSAWQRA